LSKKCTGGKGMAARFFYANYLGKKAKIAKIWLTSAISSVIII